MTSYTAMGDQCRPQDAFALLFDALVHERGWIVEGLAIGDLLGQLRDDRTCLKQICSRTSLLAGMMRQACTHRDL